jgi:hypothetical protein
VNSSRRYPFVFDAVFTTGNRITEQNRTKTKSRPGADRFISLLFYRTQNENRISCKASQLSSCSSKFTEILKTLKFNIESPSVLGFNHAPAKPGLFDKSKPGLKSPWLLQRLVVFPSVVFIKTTRISVVNLKLPAKFGTFLNSP